MLCWVAFNKKEGEVKLRDVEVSKLKQIYLYLSFVFSSTLIWVDWHEIARLFQLKILNLNSEYKSIKYLE